MSLDRLTATESEISRWYDIPVKTRARFTEDCIFVQAIKNLSPKWASLLGCNCCNPDPDSDSKNMDNVTFQKDKFQVVVDCRGFKPQDIRCSVTKDTVEMVARNENSNGNATEFLQRNTAMNRSYTLPRPINPDKTVCHLSCDGFLVVTAPWLT